jgi:hypothetical protein
MILTISLVSFRNRARFIQDLALLWHLFGVCDFELPDGLPVGLRPVRHEAILAARIDRSASHKICIGMYNVHRGT